jgi:hypothetical protein
MNRETKHDDLNPVLFNESKISFLRYSSETQFTSALLLLIGGVSPNPRNFSDTSGNRVEF